MIKFVETLATTTANDIYFQVQEAKSETSGNGELKKRFEDDNLAILNAMFRYAVILLVFYDTVSLGLFC